MTHTLTAYQMILDNGQRTVECGYDMERVLSHMRTYAPFTLAKVASITSSTPVTEARAEEYDMAAEALEDMYRAEACASFQARDPRRPIVTTLSARAAGYLAQQRSAAAGQPEEMPELDAHLMKSWWAGWTDARDS